jgi:hypothetical protein
MQIVYTDDKKEKYQSVKATASHTIAGPMGWSEIYLEGVGATELEANTELLRVAEDLMVWINDHE